MANIISAGQTNTVRVGNVELDLVNAYLKAVRVNGEPVAAQSIRIAWDRPNAEARVEINFIARPLS